MGNTMEKVPLFRIQSLVVYGSFEDADRMAVDPYEYDCLKYGISGLSDHIKKYAKEHPDMPVFKGHITIAKHKFLGYYYDAGKKNNPYFRVYDSIEKKYSIFADIRSLDRNLCTKENLIGLFSMQIRGTEKHLKMEKQTRVPGRWDEFADVYDKLTDSLAEGR